VLDNSINHGYKLVRSARGKKISLLKNATANSYDWYGRMAGDGDGFQKHYVIVEIDKHWELYKKTLLTSLNRIYY
jgi:hypothetical protein